jgi:hypothetical protein
LIKEIAVLKHIILSAVAMLLAGCGSLLMTQESLDKARDSEMLQECLATTHIQPMIYACINKLPWFSTADAKAQARKHWDDYVTSHGPDVRLLGAVLSRDIAAAKAAIAAGANANWVYPTSFQHGRQPASGARDSNFSVLMAAGHTHDLELIELLLQHGADPHWKDPNGGSDFVHNFLPRKVQMAELAVKYGYRPDAQTLSTLHGSTVYSSTPADVRQFYLKLLDRSSAQVKTEVAAIQAQMLRRAAEREAQSAVENAKYRAANEERARQNKLAAMQRNLPKRSIGARICVDRALDIGVVTYVGYVENVAAEKVQIRVNQAFFRSSPSLSPGGFQPMIVWDYPDDWRLCE